MRNIFFPNKRAKILLIDDEQDVCQFLKSILERTKKFEVYTATDPEYGILLAKEMQPDLIILDIMMPKMNGDEVAEQLLQDDSTKDIPIAFFTVLVNAEEVEKCEGKIGGHPFIPKTIGSENIILRIESILKETHAIQ